MSASSHPNAWQTAGRGGRQQPQQHHQPGSASRGPQNRSSNASPNQSQQHSAPPPALPRQQPPQHSQDARPPTSNVWTQRQGHNSHSNLASPSAANASNGAPHNLSDIVPVRPGSERAHSPLHGFNTADVKAFLAREPAIASYRSATPSTTPGAASTASADAANSSRSSGGAWGAKATSTMTSQTFFLQLAKQVATFEEGG